MIRYLNIYKSIMRINFVSLTTYRANFVNSTISAVIWALFVLAQMVLILSRTNSVFGWTKNELILLTVIYGLIVGIFHMFFARSFERFSRLMMWGNFDAVLLKPVDSQFSLSVWEMNYPAFSRLIIGGILLVYLLFGLSYHFSLINFLFFLVLIISGVLTLYSLWVIAATFIIFVPELTNILEVMYTVNGFTRFPPEMFKKISPLLFIAALPVVYIASSPLKVLVGKASLLDIMSLLIICFSSLIISRAFWLFGLRHYTSASS